MCVCLGNKNDIEELIKNGANPNLANIYGDTALMLSTVVGKFYLKKSQSENKNLEFRF